MDRFVETEFEILKLLWKNKQMSNREIHEEMQKKTGWAYSTTRTVIDRMVKKGYLRKENFHGINIFVSNISKVSGFASQISVFAEKVLEKGALEVLPLFVESDVLTDEELGELEELLNNMEDEK